MSAHGGAVLRRALAGITSVVLGTGMLAITASGPARADSAPADPANPATPPTVSGDGLPTVQMDGVAWSQVVVGNTVYVAGKFQNARPAGAAPGTQLTPRHNLLAYDIRTGALVTSFAPDLNAQALVVTASPDGSRVYVGGDFTVANGQTRNHVAAYDTATGALVGTWKPSVTGQVRAIAATGSTVYLGGALSAVGSVSRTRLAAVTAATASLLPWAPVPGVGPTSGNTMPLLDSSGHAIPKSFDPKNNTTSNVVNALVVTSGGTQVVAAGRFYSLNGQLATGVGALDATTAATLPFAIGRLITNQGVNSAILSLTTEGSAVYGTAYDYYGPGNLESAFAADENGGAVRWVSTCHGDTYSSFPAGPVLYISSHAHDCGNIGAFPEQNPQVHKFATAFSTAGTGVNGPFTIANANFAGAPAPSLLNWFPTLTAGTFTGQNQAGWSVTGNGSYISYGGEFPAVNGAPQQGLVRFAVRSIAPNAVRPTGGLAPTAVSLQPGTVRVSWVEMSDQDNADLTYRVFRDGVVATPVYQVTAASRWYDLKGLAFTDTGVPAGTHTYRVTASDPTGQTVYSAWASVPVSDGTATPRSYESLVRTDGATDLWSMDEAAGSTGYDRVGGNDLAMGTGVTRGGAGAITADKDTSTAFDGTSNATSATRVRLLGPQAFSIEAWFATTVAGGKIIGFGNAATGISSAYDRHIYLDTSGHLVAGFYTGSNQLVTSGRSYDDGKWHHVVATLGGGTLSLYADGQLVGSKGGFTVVQPMNGYWRVGGDQVWGGGSNWFNGRIDEVGVYAQALTAAQVAAHYAAGTSGSSANTPPTAAFTATPGILSAAFDGSASSDPDGTVASWTWDFGDGSAAGTGATVSHRYAAAGTYPVTLTVTDDRGATGTRSGVVTVKADATPTARFTAVASGRTVAVDGSASSDMDGTVASYAWDFGDGSTATGAKATHTYATDGAFPVTLTVTDDLGATGTTQQRVTVSSSTIASDAFNRTVTGGWGAAEVGGPWTIPYGAARFSVAAGSATQNLAAAGNLDTAYLGGAAQTGADVETSVALSAAPTGTGTFVYVTGRRVGGNAEYRARLRFLPTGAVAVGLTKLDGSASEVLLGREVVLPAAYTPGSMLKIRLEVDGIAPTTLSAWVWPDGSTMPVVPSVTTTDSSVALQASGGLGLASYLSGTSTSGVAVRFGALSAVPVQH